MSLRIPSHNRRGATLVVGLIMLVVITLVVTTAYTLSTSSLRSVGNMQYRNEAIAAGNAAIEQMFGSYAFTNPAYLGEVIYVDMNTGVVTSGGDYVVTIAKPVCVRATVSTTAAPSSVTLGSVMAANNWNTVWDIDATVTPTPSNYAASGTSVRMHSGVRVMLTQHEKDTVCD